MRDGELVKVSWVGEVEAWLIGLDTQRGDHKQEGGGAGGEGGETSRYCALLEHVHFISPDKSFTRQEGQAIQLPVNDP